MDDVPLATRLRSQRVEKTKQREDLESSTRKVLIQKKESQFLGGNSLVNDFHMKRNKVYVHSSGLNFRATCLGTRTQVTLLSGAVRIFGENEPCRPNVLLSKFYLFHTHDPHM